MQIFNRKSKGFTLMELTVVLAILAIVAVILIPTFLNTTDRARLRSDITSARAIQNAIDLYRIERGQAVAGGTNITTVLENLGRTGFISATHTDIQTENANWVIHPERGVLVDITGSPEGVHRAYISLSDAERRMVIGGRR